MIRDLIRLLGCVAVASMAMTARAEDWIELTAAEQYRIIDDGGTQTLRIPALVRSPAKAADVTIAIFGVRRDNATVAGLQDAFSIEPKLDESLGMPAVVVSVVTSKAERAGSYEIVLLARGKAGDESVEPKTFKIAFEHPEAMLRPPGSVKLERVLAYPGAEKAVSTSTKLALELTSDLSRLSKPTIGAMQITSPSDKAFNGTVKLAMEFDTVTFGASAAEELTATGAFPLGVTEFASVVRAPQLKSDVPFTVRVLTRLCHGWLWLAGVAGLVTGWLVKVWLVGYIERRRARLEARDVLRNIESAIREFPDASLIAALEPLQASLEGPAADVLEAAKLSEASKQAQTKLVEERDKYVAKLEPAVKLLAEWRGVVDTPRDLPGGMARAVVQAREALVTIDSFVKSDIKRATSALESVAKALVESTHRMEVPWREAVRTALEQVAADPGRWPANVASSAKIRATSALALLEALVLKPAERTPAGIDAVLLAWDSWRRQIAETFAVTTPRMLEDTAKGVSNLLQRVKVPAKDLEALEDVARKVAETMRATRDTPEETLLALHPANTDALELDARFVALFAGKLLPDNSTQADALATFVTQRDYFAAATLVHDERSKLPKKERADPRGITADLGPLPTQPSDSVSKVAPASPAAAPGVSLPVPPPVRISEPSTLRELRIAQGVQTLVFGGAALVVAYLTYRKSFVGTVDELAGIFAFAFGVDFTTDRIVQLIKTRETVS